MPLTALFLLSSSLDPDSSVTHDLLTCICPLLLRKHKRAAELLTDRGGHSTSNPGWLDTSHCGRQLHSQSETPADFSKAQLRQSVSLLFVCCRRLPRHVCRPAHGPARHVGAAPAAPQL